MILTICPNPCIDCTLELETLNVGRLNRVENRIENMSGKALNTAIGITRLGEKVYASGFMFETGGKRFCSFLDKEGIIHDFVWNKGRVRVNYKIIDGKSMMTEINDRGDKVTEAKQKELLEKITNLSENAEVCVISGSLPGGVEPDYYKKMVASVSKNVKTIVDCDGESLEKAITEGVYMVKPNLYELERYTKNNCRSIADMLDGCRKMIDNGAQNVLLSLGKDGAIFTDGSLSYYCKSENVAVNSTVGAGDSMLSAVSVAIQNGKEKEELLRVAVAAGTASITTPGTNLFYKDKYEAIYSHLDIKNVDELLTI